MTSKADLNELHAMIRDSEGEKSVYVCRPCSSEINAGDEATCVISPQAAKKKAIQSPAMAMDEDVEKFFKAAAQRGDYVIASVS